MTEYRIIQMEEDGIPYFAICEVYYDEQKNPYAWSAVTLVESTVEELRGAVELAREAHSKPILRIENGTLVTIGGE